MTQGMRQSITGNSKQGRTEGYENDKTANHSGVYCVAVGDYSPLSKTNDYAYPYGSRKGLPWSGSNPAEKVGFFCRKNPQHAFLRRGSKAACPMSQICGM
jgi:hypothetical protein